MRRRDFERLYAEHAGPLFGFLAYRTGHRQLAEDLLADTFERALLRRRRFDPRRGSEKSWLYAIALNLLRDHARRAAVEERALERVDAAPAEVTEPATVVEDRDAVARAMTVLGDAEREAIALRFGGGLTLPEIARTCGEPLTTVEGRVYRALRKLRAQLEA